MLSDGLKRKAFEMESDAEEYRSRQKQDNTYRDEDCVSPTSDVYVEGYAYDQGLISGGGKRKTHWKQDQDHEEEVSSTYEKHSPSQTLDVNHDDVEPCGLFIDPESDSYGGVFDYEGVEYTRKQFIAKEGLAKLESLFPPPAEAEVVENKKPTKETDNKLLTKEELVIYTHLNLYKWKEGDVIPTWADVGAFMTPSPLYDTSDVWLDERAESDPLPTYDSEGLDLRMNDDIIPYQSVVEEGEKSKEFKDIMDLTRLAMMKFNIKKGTDYEVYKIEKLHKKHSRYETYYITFTAKDPTDATLKSFQAKGMVDSINKKEGVIFCRLRPW